MVTTCTTFWSFLSLRGLPAAHGDNMHLFWSFLSPRGPPEAHGDNTPLFGLFCHRMYILQSMVTALTTFWSFLSLWGLAAAHSDSTDHILVSSVIASTCCSPWWQHRPPSGPFCHREGFLQPIVTALTIFWSFLSLRGLAADHGDSTDQFLHLSVTARPYHSSWWQNRPLSGPFCTTSTCCSPWWQHREGLLPFMQQPAEEPLLHSYLLARY